VFAVDDDPCSVFTNGNHKRRERLAHAANDTSIVEWARTFRIDAPPSDELQDRLSGLLSREGIALRFGGSAKVGRTYVLIEGPQSIDPAEIDENVFTRSFSEAIIALAIEPVPADALPILVRALGGSGGPAGVLGCDVVDGTAIVEFAPSMTQASLITELVDIELRRFSGHRRTTLLAPLPESFYARIAADGLQAPEIAAGRVLESLLGGAGVE
jgi:hypothetical protein